MTVVYVVLAVLLALVLACLRLGHETPLEVHQEMLAREPARAA